MENTEETEIVEIEEDGNKRPRINWALADWNKTAAQIAADLGCDTSSVYHYAKENFIELPKLKRGPQTKIDYSLVDWDAPLGPQAAALGVSRQALSNHRPPGHVPLRDRAKAAEVETDDWAEDER